MTDWRSELWVRDTGHAITVTHGPVSGAVRYVSEREASEKIEEAKHSQADGGGHDA